MNPYTQELLGREHRADLDREAGRARLVAGARAARPSIGLRRVSSRLASLIGSTGGHVSVAGSTDRSQLSAIVAELRRTRERLAELERSLEAIAGD